MVLGSLEDLDGGADLLGEDWPPTPRCRRARRKPPVPAQPEPVTHRSHPEWPSHLVIIVAPRPTAPGYVSGQSRDQT
jgi:hypothetical protein